MSSQITPQSNIELKLLLEEVSAQRDSIQLRLEEVQKQYNDIQSHLQPSSSKQHRQLRMMLQDAEFQVKRMKEDIATERTIAQIQKIKLVKSHEQKIGDLKKQLQYQNDSWIRRFDIRNQEYKKQIQKSIKKVQQEYELKLLQSKQKYQQEIQNVNKRKYQSEQHLKKQILNLVAKHQKQKKDIIQGLQRKWATKVTEIQNKLLKDFDVQRKQLQSNYQKLQELRKHSDNENQMLKKKLQKTKISLNKQIYQLQTQKQTLQSKIKETQQSKQILDKQKKQLLQKAEQTKKQFNKKIQQIEQNHERERQQIKLNQKSISEGMLISYFSAINRLEKKIIQLNQNHNKQIQEYHNHLDIVKNCYNQRPSRSEDLQMIRWLEDKLWKKENQLEMVGKDLKEYRLELENKQEVYTKIFTNGSILRELKFPVEKSLLRMPLTINKQQCLNKTKRGKSLLNRVCPSKNNSFSQNIPLAQMGSKFL